MRRAVRVSGSTVQPWSTRNRSSNGAVISTAPRAAASEHAAASRCDPAPSRRSAGDTSRAARKAVSPATPTVTPAATPPARPAPPPPPPPAAPPAPPAPAGAPPRTPPPRPPLGPVADDQLQREPAPSHH